MITNNLSKEQYFAVIGDIIHSKQITNRGEVQKKLHKVLAKINEKYAAELASRFTITLGDEFQGLIKFGRNVINIISEIEIEMNPVAIRFAIGLGEITTDINPDIALGADGPAYYHARAGINKLKESQLKNKQAEATIMIVSSNEATNDDSLLNTILALCGTIKRKWTERQKEIVYDVLRYGDNQLQAAKRLGISQSSVQKSLAGSGYYAYKHGMDTVAHALSEMGGG